MQSQKAMLESAVIELRPVAVPRTWPVPMRLRDIGERPRVRVATITLRRNAAAGGMQFLRVVAIALAISVAVHGGAAYWLTRETALEMAGAGGDSEAVGVELVQGFAVESMASAASTETAASAQVNTIAGEESTEQQTPLAAADTSLREKTDPLPTEANAQAPEIAATPDPKPDAKPEQAEVATDDGKGKDDARNAAQEGKANGGETSRGASDAAIAAEAAVAASEGEMSRYAAGVHAAIMRQRPRHRGASGRVELLFSLAPQGEVQYAEVKKSSGDADLDSTALAALQRMHFPPPPARATSAQLSYITTIKFR